MTIQTLYTGGGVSLSPQTGEGRTASSYVRLIADAGRAVTDGATITTCVDVLASAAGAWSDCAAPTEEDNVDDATALAELLEVIQ